MSTTLTVRIDPEQQDALERRAASRGLTVSALVREILATGLAEGPLGTRTAGLRGRLRLAPPADDVRKQIKDRNWRA